MRFVVVWNDQATYDVDAAWNAADDLNRERIVRALTAIEHLLQLDPMHVGESREIDEKRVVTRSPVTVHFRVEKDKRLVRVFAARVYR